MFRRMFKFEDGAIRVRLDDKFRDLLRRVTEELREMLIVDEMDELRRLYPTAYPDDEKLEAEYRSMVHDQLLMSRLDGIDKVQATLDNETLSIEDADTWMNTINQCRLVLGTRLDVGEHEEAIEEDDPDAHGKIIYQVLSMMLEELTSARIQSLQ